MDKLAELEKELLADMEENPVEYKETVSNVFEIDSNLRTINIPITVKNIGVESDGDVKRLEFTIPREYGEFDLSQFRIRINYMNANGDKSIYLVEDKKVSGDNITFSWLVGRNVTKYKGQVNFIVCLKLSDEKGEILKELNTTLCRLEVLEGLEVVPVIDEKTTDIIEQLLRMVETETTGAVQKVTEEGNKQVKEVQKAAQEIVADREQIQKNAESVTVLKEDLSTLEDSFLIAKDVSFFVKEETEHSSMEHQMIIDVKCGETYFLTITSDLNTTVYGYEFKDGIGTQVVTATTNVTHTLVASKDFNSFGLYIPRKTSDATYTIHIESENTVSAKRITDFKNETRKAISSMFLEVKDIEKGSWENGKKVNDAKRIRSKNSYKVKKGDVMYFKPNSFYVSFSIYKNETNDTSQNPIELTSFLGNGETEIYYTIQNDGYLTCIFGNGDNYGTSTNITVNDYVSTTFLIKSVKELISENFEYEDISKSNIESGSWENGKKVNDAKRIRSKNSYKVEKGTLIAFNSNLFVCIQVWDSMLPKENAKLLETSEWLNNKTICSYVVKNDGYLTCIFGNGDNYGTSTNITVNDYNGKNSIISLGKDFNKLFFSSEFNYKKLERRIYNLETGPDKLTDYWEKYITNKIVDINNNVYNCALNGDNFIFLTDYHIEQNSGYSHILIKKIIAETTINNVMFGGDIYNGSATKEETLLKSMEFIKRFAPIKIYGTRGNHEFNWNDGGSVLVGLNENEIYNELIKNIEEEVVTNGALSFYKDNRNQKIRYIFMDSHNEVDTNQSVSIISKEELDWLNEKMTELTNEWTIVVFTHNIFNMSSHTLPVSYSPNGKRIVEEINKVKQTMNAKLACVICGHTHFDYSNIDNGFLIITTTCDSRQDSGQWINWNGGAGTIKEHAFDVFSIDTANKKIKTVRVGRGENREWNY